MEKKLCRSTRGHRIAGVCGGFAEYFGVDAALIRVIWAIFSLGYGIGILAYIICAVVIPKIL